MQRAQRLLLIARRAPWWETGRARARCGSRASASSTGRLKQRLLPEAVGVAMTRLCPRARQPEGLGLMGEELLDAAALEGLAHLRAPRRRGWARRRRRGPASPRRGRSWARAACPSRQPWRTASSPRGPDHGLRRAPVKAASSFSGFMGPGTVQTCTRRGNARAPLVPIRAQASVVTWTREAPSLLVD